MTNNNHIIVDLSKVQFASFYYKNQWGNVVRKNPPKYSVHGTVFDPKSKALCFGEPITMLELAKSAKLLDVWKPVCRLQLTANHSLTYTGEKAKSIWKEWGRRIFEKKK